MNGVVVKLHGDSAMRQAMAQGLMGPEYQEEIDRLNAENARLRRENGDLKINCVRLEALRKEHRREKLSEYGRRRRRELDRYATMGLLFTLGALAGAGMAILAVVLA